MEQAPGYQSIRRELNHPSWELDAVRDGDRYGFMAEGAVGTVTVYEGSNGFDFAYEIDLDVGDYGLRQNELGFVQTLVTSDTRLTGRDEVDIVTDRLTEDTYEFVLRGQFDTDTALESQLGEIDWVENDIAGRLDL